MARPSGKPFVGLDIGSQTIKVAEARGAGNSLQITALGMENTPPGAIQGGIVTDPKALGSVIRSLLSKSSVGARQAVSAAAGAASVVVRVIDVPRMTPTELAETMKWEVERHIPFAANDVEMAYHAVEDPTAPADPNNPNMEVLLAVAQRDMIGNHIETLRAAGLNPVVIDVEPLAAGRAVINLGSNGLAAKNVVVVNIGASNTDVGIFKNGILRFPRTIPMAGDSFTQAIANHLGLSMTAAEEEKRENATIFMDLISAPAATPDFGGEPSDPGPAGRTPFDFRDVSAASPFAEPAPASGAAAYDTGTEDRPVGMASAADLEAPVAPAGPPPADDNPFVIPSEEPAPLTATPPPPPVTSVGLPAPVGNDPLSQRRREIFDALLPVLGEFITELRRSIDYFRSRYPSDTLDQIVLCGGSARIPNLDQFIQNELGIPTVVADPFAGINVSSRQIPRERLGDLGPAFAVAVGLAARDALLGS